MKLVTFSSAQAYQKPGVLVENGIYPLPYPDMLELIRAGISGLKYLEQALEGISAHNLLSLEEVQLLAPLLRPTTIRDFYAFEQHAVERIVIVADVDSPAQRLYQAAGFNFVEYQLGVWKADEK